MLRKLNLKFLIYGCWLFCSITPILTLSGFADESSKINLTQELKKGNFLIGLKQYLGARSDNFPKKNNITFTTKNEFLTLHSTNGVKHKSKKINIVLKKKNLITPFTVERLVFGPFASYESAQTLAEKLKEIVSLNQTTLKVMGQEGRTNVLKKFDVEKMCNSTITEYKKLIN
jgi:hypothetical protein